MKPVSDNLSFVHGQQRTRSQQFNKQEMDLLKEYGIDFKASTSKGSKTSNDPFDMPFESSSKPNAPNNWATFDWKHINPKPSNWVFLTKRHAFFFVVVIFNRHCIVIEAEVCVLAHLIYFFKQIVLWYFKFVFKKKKKNHLSYVSSLHSKKKLDDLWNWRVFLFHADVSVFTTLFIVVILVLGLGIIFIQFPILFIFLNASIFCKKILAWNFSFWEKFEFGAKIILYPCSVKRSPVN